MLGKILATIVILCIILELFLWLFLLITDIIGKHMHKKLLDPIVNVWIVSICAFLLIICATVTIVAEYTPINRYYNTEYDLEQIEQYLIDNDYNLSYGVISNYKYEYIDQVYNLFPNKDLNDLYKYKYYKHKDNKTNINDNFTEFKIGE